MITLRHQDDPELEVTFHKPSEDDWSAWTDGMSSNRHTANYNLALACAEKPSQSEVMSILRDWPGLPEAAYAHLFELAGPPILADFGQPIDPERGENAERIDLRLLADAWSSIPEGARLAEPWAEYARGMLGEGVSLETIKDWLAKYPRPKQLYCVRTQRGILVFRRPGNKDIIAKESTTKTGAIHLGYKKLLLATCIYPTGPALAASLAECPAMVAVLGRDVEGMAGVNAAVVVKK